MCIRDRYGITGTTEIVYNPSYEVLFEEETKPELEGFEKGQVSELGAVNVMTGIYTGRSPKDKFIVDTPSVHDDIAWGSVNVPITQEKFNAIRSKVVAYLQNREIFILDGKAGADPVCTRKFRIINELASQNLFIHELLIRPTAEELENYGEADFTIFVAPGFKCIPEIDGTHSEAAIIVDYEQKQVVICGSQYSGEIKKSDRICAAKRSAFFRNDRI